MDGGSSKTSFNPLEKKTKKTKQPPPQKDKQFKCAMYLEYFHRVCFANRQHFPMRNWSLSITLSKATRLLWQNTITSPCTIQELLICRCPDQLTSVNLNWALKTQLRSHSNTNESIEASSDSSNSCVLWGKKSCFCQKSLAALTMM